MKISGTNQDLYMKKGVECVSIAMIGGTVARAWNLTFIGSLSGAIFPIFRNLKYSPQQYLMTAVTFTAVTHVVDYYLPIHRLFACAIGLIATASLGLRASKDLIAVSIISSAISAGLYFIEDFSYIPIAVSQVIRPILTGLGGLGSMFIGDLAASSLYHGEFELSNLRFRELAVGALFCTLACSYVYDVDGSAAFISYLTRLRNISGIAAIATYAGYSYFSRRHH